jgi:hypothetical protein
MVSIDAQARTSGVLTLFTALYAFALIFDAIYYVSLAPLGTLPSVALLIPVAAWTLLRPWSTARFTVMVATQVAVVAIDMPHVTNHSLFLAIGGAAFLLVIALRGRRLPSREVLTENLVPFLRWGTLLVYGVAMVSKLNDGFLDERRSCAVHFYGVMRDHLRFLPAPPAVAGATIWGTIVVEAVLVVLLAVPRTRLIGIGIGSVFHVILAIAGHTPFAGFAFALYALFLPDDIQDRSRAARVRYRWFDLTVRRLSEWVTRPAAPWVALATTVGPLALLTTDTSAASWLQELLVSNVMPAFLVYSAVLFTLLVVCLRAGGPLRTPRVGLRLASPVWYAAVAVLVLNSMLPYIGVKTSTTFTMYSNLRTEGAVWNHLFIPEDVRVFGLQDTVVKIVESDDPTLALAAEMGHEYVLFGLRDYVRDHPDVSLTYEIEGERRHSARAGSDPRLSAPPVLARKLLRFRQLAPYGLCQN